MGGGDQAADALRHAARPPRSRADLACRRRARSGGGTPQLDLEPALLPGLPRRLGQHLPRASGLASVGSDAVCRLVYRRRDLRPLSEPAHGRARMRLWLAPVLGPADGRAGPLCRRHRTLEARAERIPDEWPLLLQYRAPGG